MCLALVAACALLLPVAHAQDSDDDGVLPFAGASSNGSGDQGQTSGNLTIVGLAANVADDVLDAQRGSVRLGTQVGQLDIDPDATADTAIFAGAGAVPVNVAFDGVATVDLQGPGLLAAPAGVDETLVAAPQALARTAVLVLDDGTGSLQGLLTGKTLPQMVVNLGDLPELDIGLLRAKVAQHAGGLGHHRVSVVMVSLDSSGQVQFAGARVGTTDGPTEIAIP